jgi:probable addiction module antidote protein
MKKTKKIKVSDLPEFDVVRYLKSKKAMARYLNQVIAGGDASELAAALGHIARAKGMGEVSDLTGLAREALYKALKANSKPRFETISKVIQALGMRISVSA